MFKRKPAIIFFFVLSLSAFAVYQYFKIPEGIIPQSNQAETIARISFWTSISALAAAVIGLIEKLIGIKMRNKND